MTELIYMRDDLEKILLRKFPWLEEVDKESKIIFLPVGVGWLTLLENLFSEMEILLNSKNHDLRLIQPIVIEEKYGLLKVDVGNHLDEGMYHIIKKYEQKSENVCESCGACDGSLKEIDGWIKVLCDKCEEQEVK